LFSFLFLFSFLKIFLHLCTIKTPTLSAVMSEQGGADCAFQMRNGVKSFFCFIKLFENYIFFLLCEIIFYYVKLFFIM